MPLCNPFRRQDAAPTLRDRAAGLRALLGRRRPQPAAVPTPGIDPEGVQESTEGAPSTLVRDILDGWAAWGPGVNEVDDSAEGTAAWEQNDERRSRLLYAAMALPATPDSIPAKALACAWMEWVEAERPGQPRDAYGPADQLVYDIHAAIMGRGVEASSSGRKIETPSDVPASAFRSVDFGPDTHIAELTTEFCRVYGRHAVNDRAHMAGDLTEAEWLPSYRATVALMEKLEATQPKTLLGMALKSLGPIGAAGWNARADGSTDGMDVWERVGAQFQDALMADELAPISILGPDLVGLVNFSAATMEELRAVYEVADELGTAGHAQAWVGRSKVRGSSQDLNPAGRLAQWVGDALSDVVSTAISEARGRIPANDDDRRIRFEILARSIFQNDDPAGEAAFAREILATVER